MNSKMEEIDSLLRKSKLKLYNKSIKYSTVGTYFNDDMYPEMDQWKAMFTRFDGWSKTK